MRNEPTTDEPIVLTGVDAVLNLTQKALAEAEAALAASRAETAAAVAGAKEAVARFFSNGPLTDSLIAEGPWWSSPDVAGVELYEAMKRLDVLTRDLTAAAQAHDAEIARAAVEPWLRRIVDPSDVTLVTDARALIAQSPAASNQDGNG